MVLAYAHHCFSVALVCWRHKERVGGPSEVAYGQVVRQRIEGQRERTTRIVQSHWDSFIESRNHWPVVVAPLPTVATMMWESESQHSDPLIKMDNGFAM